MLFALTIAVFIFYSIIFYRLNYYFGKYIYSDVGFLCFTYFFLYTFAPAVVYLTETLDLNTGWPWAQLSLANLSEVEVLDQLVRQVIFMVVFGIIIILPSKRFGAIANLNLAKSICVKIPKSVGFAAIALLFITYIYLALSIEFQSEYALKYLRDDSEWALVRSIFNRAHVFLIYFASFFVAQNLTSKKYFILYSVVIVSAELILSMGSRIESVFVLLYLFLLFTIRYDCKIKPVSALIALICGYLIMGFLEVFRSYEYDLSGVFEHYTNYGITVVGELGSVFQSSAILYASKEYNHLNDISFGLFYEFEGIFMRNTSIENTPQLWMWRYFYPDYAVPPQTNGPIADSAFFEYGTLYIIASASILALMLNILRRSFYSKTNLYTTIIYGFVYSTSIMNLKYGIFWQLNPIIKTFIPGFVILSLFLYKKIHND
jgi:hypothetical protein